jgi:hippurate hydrolase
MVMQTWMKAGIETKMRAKAASMRLNIRLVTVAAALVVSAGAFAQGAAIVSEFKPDIVAFVNQVYPKLEPVYLDIHAHPELGFQEVHTAALLAAKMRELGFEVTEHVGKTGLVSIFRNGAGPMVLVRTELDALPMEEKTGLPYASHAKAMFAGKETYVDHSCGHDVHMTAWIGTAATLVSLKSRWHGTLMFVAQPAEEQVAGAQAMVDDGIFTRFGKPDFAFALHTSPAAYGDIGFGSGAVSSNSDDLLIVFKGRGGHGSAPDKTIDPVLMASRFVVDLQSVISREKNPFEFGVVSIGAIDGGTAGNIIPDSVTLRGTIRSYLPEVRAKMHDGIRRTALGVAAMANAPAPEITIRPGGVAVINDAGVVARTEATLKAAFGDKVYRTPPITASEDFSAFVNQGIPSMMFSIGVYDPQREAESKLPDGKPLPSNHSPYFAPVPEPTIKNGIEAMSLAVLTALRG